MGACTFGLQSPFPTPGWNVTGPTVWQQWQRSTRNSIWRVGAQCPLLVNGTGSVGCQLIIVEATCSNLTVCCRREVGAIRVNHGQGHWCVWCTVPSLLVSGRKRWCPTPWHLRLTDKVPVSSHCWLLPVASLMVNFDGLFEILKGYHVSGCF